MDKADTLSARIKSLRKRARLTQADLGKSLGISAVAVGAWERGTSGPSANSVIQLSKIFGVDPDFILYGREPKKAEQPSRLDCVHCNRRIPPARRDNLPGVQTCVECQSLIERGVAL